MLKKILTTLVMLYAAASFAAVDVNKATAAELDGIKGIGPGLSGKIIEERKHGAFKDWDDFIQRVRGVGETSAGKFSAEGMRVNGRTFKAPAPPPPLHLPQPPRALLKNKHPTRAPSPLQRAFCLAGCKRQNPGLHGLFKNDSRSFRKIFGACP